MLSTGVLLQRGNARTHTACVTAQMVKDVHFEGLHHCPYSPNIAAYDYHTFWLIRKALGGKTFRSDEVQEAVQEWLHMQLTLWS
jgi:hypothetical protein